MRGRLGRPASRSALPGGAARSSDRRRRRMVLSSEDSRRWCLPLPLTLHPPHSGCLTQCRLTLSSGRLMLTMALQAWAQCGAGQSRQPVVLNAALVLRIIVTISLAQGSHEIMQADVSLYRSCSMRSDHHAKHLGDAAAQGYAGCARTAGHADRDRMSLQELCFGAACQGTREDGAHLGVQMLRPGPRRLRRYCGETGVGLSLMLQACCGSAARCFASSSSRETALTRRAPVLAPGRAWLSACCSSSARCGWSLQCSPSAWAG